MIAIIYACEQSEPDVSLDTEIPCKRLGNNASQKAFAIPNAKKNRPIESCLQNNKQRCNWNL